MSLEQTIRNQKLQESADLAARLDQLVRAGLMPSQSIPALKTSLSKMQSGITLHGREVAVLNDLINSMLFIVLGDDAIFNKARAGAKATYQQTREEKEKTEYDYEGDMAMGQLKSIIANSQRMHDMLSDDTNLPEWVQSKITLAEDYISTASNYMQGEMSEEKIDEVAPLLAVAGVAGRMVASRLAAKAGAGVATRAIAGAAGSAAASSAVKKFSSTKETNEEIDKDLENELKATRVTKKSMDDSKKTRERASGMKEEAIEEKRGLWDNIHAKRKRIKAGSGERMRKPGSDGAPSAADLKASQTEEVEQIDEISKATAGRYINKAKDSIDTTSWRQGYREAAGKPLSSFEKKLTKRHKGISMAVKKLTKEDIEAVKSMHESYKNTFNAALEHYNIKSPSELGEDKRKEFFNHVDQKFKKGDN